jgi:hypothetical protein
MLKKSFFHFTLILLFLLLINSMETLKLSNESESQSPIFIIQGTYYGGCGLSYISKRQTVEDIKKYILKNYGLNLGIESKLKNYKVTTDAEEPYKTLDQFNEKEFNIFIILNGIRKLMGSSDINNPEFYYAALGGSVYGEEKQNFLKSFSEKIMNYYSKNLKQ